MNKKIIGDKGEAVAVEFLKKKNYQILAQNYLKRSGEVDIIAHDPSVDETVFVEVKTRKNSFYGYPEDFVDELKLDKIESVADYWLKENNISDGNWRIDIIALIGDSKKGYQLEHIQNV